MTESTPKRPIDGSEASAPGTHALIIGVNHYSHLRGGDLDIAAATLGLGQLSSPVLSALAIDGWLRTEYTNRAAPLKSVELLLSPPPEGVGVQRATIGNIKAAFDRWFARCNQFEDNVAVFYFCGHGVQAEILTLLAEDFGASRLRLWENAIDFNGTFFGMGSCRAKTQCYFLDCCREVPLEALKQLGRIAASPLITVETLRQLPRDAPVLQAAMFGRLAHAEVNSVSYFTQGLLDCLRRLGARGRSGDRWLVNTASLRESLKVRMWRSRLASGERLCCDDGLSVGNVPATDIHELAGPAQIQTDIVCKPVDALGHASLKVTLRGGPSQTRAPSRERWELDLDGSDGNLYDAEAAFETASPFSGAEPVVGERLFPPHHTITLWARP